MRYDDEIVAFGGRPIRTVNAFKNVLGIFPKGWKVPLSYRRDGKRYDVVVRLAGVHGADELIAKTEGRAPKPPDKPKDPDKPDDKPERPKLPDLLRKRQPKMPEHIKKYFESRSGYANYYFNKLNRDRTWKAMTAHGDFTDLSGEWKITAEIVDGGATQLTLNDKTASIALPSLDATVDLTKDLDTQLAPADSGGLLVALSMWRRLLLLGPEKYGEVYYLGTAPLPDAKTLAELGDVLVATHDVAETRFQFDPESSRLVALEMYPNPESDPCEIRFEDYRDTDAGQLPHRLEIRHGDHVYAVIKVKSFTLPRPTENEA